MSVSGIPTTGAVHVAPQAPNPAPPSSNAVGNSDKKGSSKRLLDITA